MGAGGAGGAAPTGASGATLTAGNAGGAATTSLSGAGGNAPGSGGTGAPGNASTAAVAGGSPGGGGAGARNSATATNRGGSDGGSGKVSLVYATACTTVSVPFVQGFNSTSMPSCWFSNQGTSKITFVPSSNNPTASAPSEGADFVKFNSAAAIITERLVSPFMNTSTSANLTMTFDWWESSANTTATEGVAIEYTLDGANFTAVGTLIPRYNAAATAGGGWVSKSVTMPVGFLGQSAVAVSLTFTGAGGDNCYLDNLKITAPCVAPATQATNLTFPSVGTGQISGTFTASASAPSGYLVVRYAHNVTATNPANGLTYTAGTALGSGSVVYAGTGTSFVNSGLAINTSYDYYVYDYNSGTCLGGPVYNTTSPLFGTRSTNSCPTFASLIQIDAAATRVDGSVYNTLTDCLLDLSGCSISAPVVIELQSNYVSTNETYPLVLNAVTGMSATNTITIRPASGASNLAIAGSSLIPSGAGSIIYVNGGTYWKIDGRSGGTGSTRNLTVQNTDNTTSGSAAIRFINGAQFNTVTYCNVKSSNIALASGTINFSTGSTVGNSNNTISFCNVGDGANGTSSVGISSVGSAGFPNDNNTLNANNIFNFFNASGNSYGVYISDNTTNTVITGNSIYSTAARVQTSGSDRNWAGIGISPTTASSVFGINISGNFIGGTAPNCGGTALTLSDNGTANIVLRGIFAQVGTSVATSIQGNTITNFNVSSSSTAANQSLISAVTGSFNIGDVTGNVLGSTSAAGSVTFTQTTAATSSRFCGIIAGAGTPGAMVISNNSIGGISVANSSTGTVGLAGIYATGTSPSYTITGNSVGSPTVSASMNNTTTDDNWGVFLGAATGSNSVSGNTIANITALGRIFGIRTDGGINTVSGNTIHDLLAGSTQQTGLIGIWSNSALASQTISGNTIHSLTSTDAGAATFVNGIYLSVATAGTTLIEKNFIHSLNLSTSSISGSVYGIRVVTGAMAVNIQNNMIRLGINAAGTGITTGYSIWGIANASTAATNHWFNTVYIGGTSVSGTASNTYALLSSGATNTRAFTNNVLVNARSGGSAGKNYAISIGGTGVNPTGLASNYNLLRATGTNGFTGLYASTDRSSISDLNTATGQDARSINCDPGFTSAAGDAASVNLHINSGSPTPVEGSGIVVADVTEDFDGQTRSSLTQTDLGADAGNFTSLFGSTTISLTTGTTALCEGSTATLTSASATGNLWSTGETTQSIVVSASGTYTVRSISGSCTSASGNAIVITVNSAPAATVTAGGTTTFCSGSNVTLTASAGNTYLWSNGLTTSSISVGVSGDYSVTVSYLNGCSKTSDETSVTVLDCQNLTWTGAVSSDWNTGGNWSAFFVPLASNGVTIANTTVKPVVSGTANAKSFTVNSGALVTVSGTLNVSGNYTNNGTVTVSGKLSFNGTAGQTISGSGTNSIYNLDTRNTSGVTNLSGSTVKVGNTLSFTSGGKYINAGSTVLTSGAAGTARLGTMATAADYSGNLTTERYIAGDMGSSAGTTVMLGSPFSNTTLGSYEDVTSPMFGFPGVPDYYNGNSSVWMFDPLNTDTLSGWVKPAGKSIPFTSGMGARIFYSGYFLLAKNKISVTGTLPASLTHTLPTSYCASGCAPGMATNGWNIVGNPVPAEISWKAAGWTKTNIGNAIYIWHHKTKQYSVYSYNPNTGDEESLNGGTDVIASGQSFFVEALGSSSLLTANESVKVNGTTPYAGLQRLATGLRLKIKAQTPDTGLFAETVISFRSDASAGLDIQDTKLKRGTYINIGSVPVSGVNLAINRMPEVNGQNVLPLYFSSEIKGTHTLDFSGIAEFIAAGNTISLKDYYTHTITNLGTNSVYSFTVNNESYSHATGRFELLYGTNGITGNAALSAGRFNVYPNPGTSQALTFEMSGLTGSSAELRVTDALGREVSVKQVSLNAGSAIVKPELQLQPGVYAVSCISGGKNLVQHIVVTE